MTDSRPPRPVVVDAPGLAWRPCKAGWEARWRPRQDLVRRGYPGRAQRLWMGSELNERDHTWLSDRCNVMQKEMLLWGRGGIKPITAFDGTLRSLIGCYQTDPLSPFHKIRYRTRINYQRQLKRIAKKYGDTLLSEIKARTVLEWHRGWLSGKDGGTHIEMAHQLVGMIRTVIKFGMVFLEDEQCERLVTVLHAMRFEVGKPREEWLTAEQATAIRAAAHTKSWYSIALAQAFQFECTMRQMDIIGEWVPYEEPGMSDVHHAGQKWLRGIQWQEINNNLILRHITSKRQKEIVIDLKNAPMVLAELEKLYPGFIQIDPVTEEPVYLRHILPSSKPVIVNEETGRPYNATTFRMKWRELADTASIPKNVRNMDSRAGAITEATDADANIEHVRQAATHSNITMTQRYSRDGQKKTATVMKLRVAHRNKGGT